MNNNEKIFAIISFVSFILVTQLFTCYNNYRTNRELSTLGQSIELSRTELDELGETIRSQESTIGELKTIQLGINELSNKYQDLESGLNSISGELNNISEGLDQSELDAEGYESNAYRSIQDTREVLNETIQELRESGVGE